jgi:hypothetical protein
MKALALALLISIVPPPLEPCQVYQAQKRYEFIEEHNLQRVYLSCYLPTGNNCADGTPPVEGVVSSNREHLGMDCIVYDADLTAVMRLECRDIGGHKMLREGTAIDVYRDSMERAYQLRDEYGLYVWVEWINREETEDGQGD